MNYEKKPLSPGLYLVATPIGTARDITLRALDILASADVLAAEDTRTLRKLMDIHGIPLDGRRVHSYHDHSGDGARQRIINVIKDGRSVAYASEAGTPLIADPGYGLVVDIRAAGMPVTAAPGPSAIITALSIAGLPTDRFTFYGFPPSTKKTRAAIMEELKTSEATAVFYEAPRRVAAFLREAADALGPTRPAVLCRELTKRFEEVTKGPLAALASDLADRSIKGECVILIAKAEPRETDEATVLAALNDALTTTRLKDASADIALRFGLPKRDVYQMGLSLQSREADSEKT